MPAILRYGLIGLGVIVVIVVVLAAIVFWQMGVHLWDDSQVPIITVSEGLNPVFTFTPDAAYELNVYEGSEDGDGLGVLWNARGPGSFENNLHSPVTYGVPPEGFEGQTAEPLEVGKTYTVVIFRKDPKGQGDGFTNTRHRYVGSTTFTATGD